MFCFFIKIVIAVKQIITQPELPNNAKKSRTKIVSAMMTIIYFFRVRKKLFTLPYMPLSACPLHNRHPPVVAQKDTKSDHPLQKNPANIINAKEDQPQTSVFAALI